MDMLGMPQDASRRIDTDRCVEHEFLTHDQRASAARELEYEDLDDRERAIFLRCGFRAPQAA